VRRSHYDVLGITPNAKLHEIERAWRRLRSEMQQEAAAPDPRRALLLQTAYEVLSDPARRDAYDQSLRTPLGMLQRAGASSMGRWIAAGAAIAAALAGAAWFALGSSPGHEPRDEREIAQAVSLAVGRLQGVDVSGHTAQLGLAFAVAEGSLASSCQGLSPSSQLVVRFAQREVPARVATLYAANGVCRLSAYGMGSWPLAVRTSLPQRGDRIYAAKVGATGQVSLVEGRVRRVFGEDGVTHIDVNGPASLQPAGGPLLDDQGRVLGVGEGGGRYTPMPAPWLAEMNGPKPVEVPKAAPPPEPERDPIDEEAHRRAQALKVPGDI